MFLIIVMFFYLIGSSTSHELSLNDFIFLYGSEFMNANQKYVQDFLNELHQRKFVFKSEVFENLAISSAAIPSSSDINDQVYSSSVNFRTMLA